MSLIGQTFSWPVSAGLVCWAFPALEDSAPCVSHVSGPFVTVALTVCSQLSFQGCLYSE